MALQILLIFNYLVNIIYDSITLILKYFLIISLPFTNMYVPIDVCVHLMTLLSIMTELVPIKTRTKKSLQGGTFLKEYHRPNFSP